MGAASRRSLTVSAKTEPKLGVLGGWWWGEEDVVGPGVRLRGEGQTLECVTKG